MNLKVSGVGAEPKKMAALGALAALLIGVYFYNRTPSADSAPAAAVSATIPQATAPMASVHRPNRMGRNGQSPTLQEFRPSLKPKKGEEINRADIDPTLRLDLLEKVQSIGMEGGTRSLFESSSAPVQVAKLVKEPPKVIPTKPIVGPMPPPPVAKVVEPPPPPIPLKFYGFVNPRQAGNKRAFFLDGEDIIVATEGQLVKNRYKIVRIGVNSAVVEDTQVKNNQQTLPLVEEQAG
jgi:hypothetical protein